MEREESRRGRSMDRTDHVLSRVFVTLEFLFFFFILLEYCNWPSLPGTSFYNSINKHITFLQVKHHSNLYACVSWCMEVKNKEKQYRFWCYRRLTRCSGAINLKKDYLAVNSLITWVHLYNVECQAKGGEATAKKDSQGSGHCVKMMRESTQNCVVS
jgi:hypothetical protein